MTLRTGIVGCGNIADGHVEVLTRLKDVEVAAVCDLEILMAEQLATRHGISAHYASFEEMLGRENLDVVHITTPPQAHVDLALRALDAGCHVFVEKPIGMCLADAKKIIDRARETRKKLTVGHIYQFDPPALALRKLLSAGTLGDPVHMESHFGYNLGGSFARAVMGSEKHWVHALPGKIFQNNMSHVLSKIVEFLPTCDLDVAAHAYRRSTETYGDRRDAVLDELRVLISGGGCSGYATFTSHARPVTQVMRFYGTRNTVNLDFVARTLTFEREPRLPSALGRVFPAFAASWQHFKAGGKNVFRFLANDFHFFAGMSELMRLYYDCIARDGEPPIPYEQILSVSSLIDEVNTQISVARDEGERS